MAKYAHAGRKGPDVRSDCWVKITLSNSGGIKFEMNSKVKVIYGKSIETLIRQGLEFFDINNASIFLFTTSILPTSCLP